MSVMVFIPFGIERPGPLLLWQDFVEEGRTCTAGLICIAPDTYQMLTNPRADVRCPVGGAALRPGDTRVDIGRQGRRVIGQCAGTFTALALRE